MDVAAHYRSLTAELESLRDRVRNFICDRHWLTDGEWKESVLRSMIAQRIPDTVRIGRGFVLTETGPTTQCDILLYRADSPILFREGDLAFVTSDAVLAIIEVKSNMTQTVFDEAIVKLSRIGHQLGRNRGHCCLGLFAYQSGLDQKGDDWILQRLQAGCLHESQVIDVINLGCSTFVKWWKYAPSGGDDHYEKWHAYRLEKMSAGYFISNVVDAVSPGSVGRNSRFWYPENSKEFTVTAIKPHVAARLVASD